MTALLIAMSIPGYAEAQSTRPAAGTTSAAQFATHPATETAARTEQWIAAAGPWAPLVFILIYASAVALLIPASPLTIIGGLVFGLWHGTLYTVVGATLGAVTAFGLARTLLSERIGRWIESRPKFRAVDRAIARRQVKVQALLRLAPVFPFSFLNYALGVTKVSLWSYVWTTAVFILPGTFLYTYIGRLGKRVAEGTSTPEMVGQAIGLTATLVAVVYIGRFAKRALDEVASEK